jgi:hypothetical protein
MSDVGEGGIDDIRTRTPTPRSIRIAAESMRAMSRMS